MKRTDRRLRLCITLLACNLIFIWGNSLLPGEVSGAFSDWVKSLLMRLFSGQAQVPVGGGLLRKIAHFTEFAALGMCLAWLCGMLGKGRMQPFLWGVLAAAVDETIQCFVPGRGPGIRDVCIDSAGVLAGIILLRFGYYCMKKRSAKLSLEDK